MMYVSTLLRAATLAAVVVAPLSVAHAQRGNDYYLPETPYQSGALRDDGAAVLYNPAGAAFQRGWEAGLGLRLTNHATVGDGVYGYTSYTAPFGLSIAGGLVARTADYSGVTGFVSAGYRAGAFAAALRYRVYSADDGGPMHGMSTSDLGLVWRPASFMALSLVVDNLWEPRRADGFRLGRVYRMESGWRLPNGRFGTGIEATFHEKGAGSPELSKWDLAWNARATVLRGFDLFAAAGMNVGGDRLSPTVSAGLTIHQGRLASEMAFHVHPVDGGQNLYGGSALFRVVQRPAAPLSYTQKGLLKIQLSGSVHERPSKGFLTQGGEPAFTDILMDLRRAATHPQLEGVYLHLSGTKLGVGQLWELRQALDGVRAAGREVVVYIERGGLRDLYLAAGASLIMTSPSFVAEDAGMMAERIYLGDFLARFGVEATFVRVGEYKSAVEMFTRSTPSAEADESLVAYIQQVWSVIAHGLCEGRAASSCPGGRFPVHAPINARTLEASHWSDGVGYEDELPQRLRQHFGVSYQAVDRSVFTTFRSERWGQQPSIAVIHINGSIAAGTSGVNPLTGAPYTGSRSIEREVRQILDDASIKGVIVRVDSPGGSAFASDEMLRALAGLRRAGMPVRISFGNAAASGGYYVSAFDAPIYSAPTTVTGSIGIYAGTFAIDDLLSSVGVNRVYNSVGGPAKLFQGREWSTDELAWMQASVDFGYERFVSLVADARGMTTEQVDAVARGRIWSGRDALARSLVQHEGSFLDAYTSLCRDIRACRQEDLPLRHMGKGMGLVLPTPLAAAMGIDAAGAVGTWTRLLEGLGLQGTLREMVAIFPERAGELRYDLGGVLDVNFR